MIDCKWINEIQPKLSQDLTEDEKNEIIERFGSINVAQLKQSPEIIDAISDLLSKDLPEDIAKAIAQKLKEITAELKNEDPSTKDTKEDHWASDDEIKLIMSARNGALTDLVSCLARENININARNKYGNTALIFAVRSNHHDIVLELIKDKKLDCNIRGESGYTPLHWAVNNSNQQIVLLILSHKSTNPTIQSSESGDTTLHLAAKKGNLMVYQCLIKGEAAQCINVENNDGQTPLGIALARKEHEIALDMVLLPNLLLKHVDDVDFKSIAKTVVKTKMHEICSFASNMSYQSYLDAMRVYWLLCSKIQHLELKKEISAKYENLTFDHSKENTAIIEIVKNKPHVVSYILQGGNHSNEDYNDSDVMKLFQVFAIKEQVMILDAIALYHKSRNTEASEILFADLVRDIFVFTNNLFCFDVEKIEELSGIISDASQEQSHGSKESPISSSDIIAQLTGMRHRAIQSLPKGDNDTSDDLKESVKQLSASKKWLYINKITSIKDFVVFVAILFISTYLTFII